MNTINKFILLAFIVLFTTQSSFAQKSIKRTKQQTGFLYTQLNLNGGKLFDGNPNWRFSEMSPYSNVNFTYRHKNQRLLQRGYTPFMQMSGYKASVAFVYKNPIDANGHHRPTLNLQIRDLWLKIKTKWDRTALKVGHFSLPYGHAPKMDLDNSFIPALAGQDLGFNRDFGLLFKTPASKNLDLEVALTLGGSVPSTLLSYDFSDANTSETPIQRLNKPTFDYQGNWLTTVRIGNPTYNKNEIGVFATIGKVNRTAAAKAQSYVYRIGGDWTYKHKEQFRLTNQFVLGYTSIEGSTAGWNIVQKTELDYFWMRKLMLSFSNSFNYQEYTATETFKGTAVISLSYAVNPHTRLKLNAYSKYNLKDNGQQPGLFIQLVAGLGTRG